MEFNAIAFMCAETVRRGPIARAGPDRGDPRAAALMWRYTDARAPPESHRGTAARATGSTQAALHLLVQCPTPQLRRA